MHKFTMNRVALGVGQALALAAAAGVAQAQTPPETDSDSQGKIDEVVVTGFRASLQNSIAEKRDSDQILESISAEDIGKLPDNSIAESIARAPGLTTQRLDGRAQVISIRGLAPDFSTTLLNGREQVTTGDNRSAEYDQYPAELLSAVNVYKTPQASLIGQGLSGTVDLRTVRPLAYGKRTFAGNLRAETLSLGKLNAGSDDTGYRASASYIDQYANETVGIAFGIAYMDSPTQIERFNAWGYPEVAPGVLAPGGVKPYVVSTELKRTGVTGTFEFQPTDSFNTSLDVYYTKFKDDQLLRGIELPLIWGGVPLQPGYSVEDGMVTGGEFDGVKGVVRNDANRRDAELWSAGWNARYETGNWALTGDINYSKVDRRDIILETYSGTGRGVSVGATDNMTFTRNGEGVVTFDSSLNYADAASIFLTSPQGWGDSATTTPGGQDGFINSPNIQDKLTAGRIGAEYAFEDSWAKGVDFGVSYSKREKDYGPDRYYLGLVANANDPEHDVSVPVPGADLLNPTKLGFLGIPAMISYDPIGLAYSGAYNFVPAADASALTRNWSVGEDVLSTYAMLRIDSDIGDMKLTGNVGVQFVQTDQDSQGTAASTSNPVVPVPVSASQDYSETLPSLNLSLRVTETFVTRLGLARQMARPRMDEMRAGVSYGYNQANADSDDINQSPWSGEGGNPMLRPWIADAADVSFEKYFGGEGYVSAALYYKKLKSYIYTQPQLYDFSGFPVTGPEPVLREGFVTTPQNAEGGKIYGYELAGTVPFGLMTDVLEGFGLTGSYSYTKSNIQPDPNNPARPIPGLSEDVINATLYYERFGFSARVSGRHRSEFQAEVQGVGAERLLREAEGETLVDAQISYELQSGAMQGLTFLLQGTNLSDEPFITHDLGQPDQVIDHQTFGRRYLFGVSFKY